MDTFEKQQRVDAIKGIVWMRWYAVAIIVALGLLLKTKYYGGMWGDYFDLIKILGMGALAFCYNLCFWFYLRRPAEKMSDKSLEIVAALQIVLDQLLYTLIYYYTGTVETIAFLLYFLTILIASSFYKTKGIILTGFLAVFLYTSATLADYYKLVPHVYPFPGAIGWFGNTLMTRVKITGFIFYTGAAVFFSAALSNLLRKREEKVRQQRDQLQDQTNILTLQTQELTQAKDKIEGALTRSDIARKAATQARDGMEKANVQLKQKIDELEKFYKITVGREVRVAELKQKIKELEREIKKLKE